MIRVDAPDEVELEWWPDAVAVLKITVRSSTPIFGRTSVDRTARMGAVTFCSESYESI
jgi:hypothetical protein